MKLFSDKQTLDDLNITGKFRTNSLFFLFNQVKTAGGEKLLDHYFRHPLTDVVAINARSQSLQWFQARDLELPFTAEEFEQMENYLVSGREAGWLSSIMEFSRRRFFKLIGLPAAYDQIVDGVDITRNLLYHFLGFLRNLQQQDNENPFHEAIRLMEEKVSGKLTTIAAGTGVEKLSVVEVFKHDRLLRHSLHHQMQALLEMVYQLDVYISTASVGRLHGWNYASALPAAENILELRNVKHPALAKAIGNNISMNRHRNMIFLTGANMAGKSTLMKSVGAALYLAHMGFPVPADQMDFSVKDAIITSINVPDNIDKGLSHFYAEVLRVKQVAQLVRGRNDVMVIFDELFKGTNVKDAFDATLAVTEAFAAFENCHYIISTHIIEVGEGLKQSSQRVQFSFMPTIMEGNQPRYPYALQEGITQDRHGMTIIENEKILEILHS